MKSQDQSISKLLLPLMNARVRAGFPSPATDYIEERIDLNDILIRHPSSTFLIRVEGDSLVDAHIPDKALLIVDRSLTAKNNDIIVATVDGDFTVKRYVIKGGEVFLYPANVLHKPLHIKGDTDFLVWGVVTTVILESKHL